MRLVAVACVAAWLGIMAFFSLAVAPLVFDIMERTAAGHVVSAVLPRYYITGLGLCAIALVTYVTQLAARRAGRVRSVLGVVLCTAMIGMIAWVAAVAAPQVEAARRSGDDTAFARAHRSSVAANAATMAAALALLVIETVTGTGTRAPRRRR
jgi:hypothetical protein